MALIADYALDAALAAVAEATHLYLCNASPTSYAEASSTYAVGVKATPTIGSPGDASPNGRKVTVSAITDGEVTATGTPTHWALVDANNSRLLGASTITNGQVVTDGNTFTLGAFDIRLPDAA